MKAKLLKHKKVLIVIGIVIVIFVLFNIFKPQIAKVVLNDDEQHVLALVQKVKKCAKGSQIGDDFSAYKKIDPCENDRFICYSVVYEIDDGLMVCCSIEHISSEKLSETQGRAIRNDKRALVMIAALASHLPDISVIGEIPYELSLQMMLYELDPEKEIFSEDERVLIEEYALQFRDMNRSRELAEHICYQEEYGNQDVAPVVIKARREIQEKKEEHLQQRKR